MHDAVATFFGGYETAGIGRRRPLRVRWVPVALGVAVICLFAFVAADVSAYTSSTVAVNVTSVSWYAEGMLLTTVAGFSLHTSQTTTLTLSCDSICYRFNGATVSAPFTFVSFSVVNEPVQYTNVTVRAPSSAYVGPVTISLTIG